MLSLTFPFSLHSVVPRPLSVFVDANQPLDVSLFVRPFTPASWGLVLTMTASVMAALLAVSALTDSWRHIDKEELVSWKMLTLSGIWTGHFRET